MFKRTIAKDLMRLAAQYPVVTITGPRQSGKTTLCKNVFPDYSYVNLEDLAKRNYAEEDPKSFLSQFKDKVIFDEIQRAPKLVSYIQVLVDENPTPGKFILTGSQQFEVSNAINQSLAGRTALLKLLPLSYEELYGADSQATDPLFADIIYQGFYPRIHDKNLLPTEALSFYLSTYVERDLRSLLKIHDLAIFERFLRLCASQVGQLINYSSIASDCGINQSTVKSWLSLLQASYILYTIQPHYRNFRKRLTKASKLYFYDVGLASYLLGITKSEHVVSHPLRGALFENFIVSEFVKNCYNHVRDMNLYFFRDHVGNEIDLILDYGNTLVAVEIKSSQTITSGMLKTLAFYSELVAKQQNDQGPSLAKKCLVYGGNENYYRQGVQIFTYQDLPKLFAELAQEV